MPYSIRTRANRAREALVALSHGRTFRPRKSDNVYQYHANCVVSYGSHYPLAVRIPNGDGFVLNTRKWSLTTSKHQRYASDAFAHCALPVFEADLCDKAQTYWWQDSTVRLIETDAGLLLVGQSIPDGIPVTRRN